MIHQLQPAAVIHNRDHGEAHVRTPDRDHDTQLYSRAVFDPCTKACDSVGRERGG